jgi:hypothetical protein
MVTYEKYCHHKYNLYHGQPEEKAIFLMVIIEVYRILEECFSSHASAKAYLYPNVF